MKDYTEPPTDTDKNGKTEAEANQDKSLFDFSTEAMSFVIIALIAFTLLFGPLSWVIYKLIMFIGGYFG